MPSAEREAWAAAEQAPRDAAGWVGLDVYMAEYRKRQAERHERLKHDARAVFRAMDGWQLVLGAERYADPELMAALLVLRRRLIDEHGATDAADLMLIDLAVLSYYHSRRINGWVGNFASLIEAEFFGNEGLTAKFMDRYGRYNEKVQGLRVDDHVERIAEQLLPLLDRCNRLMVRARTFGEMLTRAIQRYHNKAIATAQVIEELIELAREMRAAQSRGEQLGLSDAEVAFYDALEINDSAVTVLGDDVLKAIARELVEIVRNNATIDWTLKENVRSRLRVYVKRVLRRHGYPRDKQEQAAQTVLKQAEIFADASPHTA